MEMQCRRRQKNEDLLTLITDIHILVMLANVGESGFMANVCTMDAFLNALGDR